MFLAAVVVICLFLSFYAYAGYPILLAILLRLRGPRSKPSAVSEELRKISFIITVRNEAGAIREKLENTLALTYGGQPAAAAGVEFVVASDSSDDGTDDIVSEYSGRGVRLLRLPERGGKERAQKAAVATVSGDIVIFTDAKIKLAPDAIERFNSYFDDPQVGAVSSVDKIEGGATEGSGEGFYIRYEMWLRRLESDFNTLVGLSGSCFAVRKEVCRNILPDVPSDFALLIEAQNQGLRGVHAPDVVGTYNAVSSEKAEFDRKVRTVLRGITTLFACKYVMNPFRYGVFSWQIISHKLCRWLVPLFLLIAALATLALATESVTFFALAVLGVVFATLAAFGYVFPRLKAKPLFKVPLFFLIVNASIALAWLKYFTGVRTVAWDPSAKGRP